MVIAKLFLRVNLSILSQDKCAPQIEFSFVELDDKCQSNPEHNSTKIMKLKYIATIATASILTIGGTAFFSGTSFASTPESNVSTIIAGNPCAAADPCAGANPCAAADPCAGANPCAAVDPCAGANPCAAVDPCAGK